MIANESVDSNLQTNESVENESKKLKIALAKINNLELKIKQKDDYIVESKLKIKQKDDYIIKLTLKINDDYNESKKIIGIMNNTLQLSYSRIEENLNTIGTLKDDLKSCFEKITDLQKSNSTNNDTNLELWIGVGLRQNFIFEQITKLNLLRPDVDWVKPMIEEIKIPEGFYFVLGDNREVSRDSRDIGLIPKKNIIDKFVPDTHFIYNNSWYFFNLSKIERGFAAYSQKLFNIASNFPWREKYNYFIQN